MTKSELKTANRAIEIARHMRSIEGCNMAARTISALIRATATTKNRNELITLASAIPGIIQSADFII